MSLFSRIADVFKANVNDMLDKAEDPEKMIKQMVIEMEESVNKTSLAVAQAVSNEKMLERRIEKARKESEDWEQKARQALQSGREDLAKAALEKKSQSIKTADDLLPSYNQSRETSKQLRGKLSQLKAKLEEARTKKNTLIARSKAAKAQKELSQSLSGFSQDAFGGFEKYEQKVEEMEAHAEAYESLDSSDATLEEEFKKLESNSKTDGELIELKKRMGMLPESNNNN